MFGTFGQIGKLGGRRAAGIPAPVYSPEAQAYFAALSTQPNAARKARIDRLYRAFAAAGILQRSAGMNLVGRTLGHFATDLFNPARVGIAVNGPTYVPDSHFAGDGTASYFDTTFNPAANGGSRYLQDDCSMAIGSTGARVAPAGDVFEAGNFRAGITMFLGTTGDARVRAGTSTNVQYPRSANSADTIAWSRTSATATITYQNGVQIGAEAASASGVLHPYPFFIGALNTSVASRFSNQPVRFLWYGLSLTQTQWAAFHAAIVAYFNGLEGDYA